MNKLSCLWQTMWSKLCFLFRLLSSKRKTPREFTFWAHGREFVCLWTPTLRLTSRTCFQVFSAWLSWTQKWASAAKMLLQICQMFWTRSDLKKLLIKKLTSSLTRLRRKMWQSRCFQCSSMSLVLRLPIMLSLLLKFCSVSQLTLPTTASDRPVCPPCPVYWSVPSKPEVSLKTSTTWQELLTLTFLRQWRLKLRPTCSFLRPVQSARLYSRWESTSWRKTKSISLAKEQSPLSTNPS